MAKMVSKVKFMETYQKALEEMQNSDEFIVNGIYGSDVIITWNGISCNLGDGATVYNHIISNIPSVIEESDDEPEDLAVKVVPDSEYIITRVYPCYTGGGIYIYLGELLDGRGFVAYDLSIGEVGGIAITKDFQENYFDDDYELFDYVLYELDDESVKGFNFWNAMIDWIIENKPQNDYCNYQMSEIEERKAGKGDL